MIEVCWGKVVIAPPRSAAYKRTTPSEVTVALWRKCLSRDAASTAKRTRKHSCGPLSVCTDGVLPKWPANVAADLAIVAQWIGKRCGGRQEFMVRLSCDAPPHHFVKKVQNDHSKLFMWSRDDRAGRHTRFVGTVVLSRILRQIKISP